MNPLRSAFAAAAGISGEAAPQALASWLDALRAAFPELTLDDSALAASLGAALASTLPVPDGLRVEELWLARECVRGGREALALFETHVLAKVRASLRRI